ncbi:GWT1-domain-containing protein [Mycena pura]|uniref:GPI-anchored wall transfer protein n=1 Tax=Mycena pura TaxID=153505 RepID=A0AAD6YQQ2_9AGAR|nr:GWT1-domain-containing protein [Mycena pura]
MNEYKASKEAFVSGMTGSTIFHVNLISSVALASIALYSALRTRVCRADIPFVFSWMILVLPLILSMTLFADNPVLLVVILLVPTILVCLRAPRLGATIPLAGASQGSAKSPPAEPKYEFNSNLAPLPALTTYRAHMMLMTVLGILAVDFPVFPRSLAKCESYGVSLMDLGVGSFVFSNGVVSAIPLIKYPRYLQAPLFPKLCAVVQKTLPIIALGVIRVLLVKGTEYPEHETEYGTHWNFFITLALLPVFQVLLHPLIYDVLSRDVPLSCLGAGFGLLQQLALSKLGLKEYVKTAPRINLISANKEGIASLLGYLSIHTLGISIGTIVLPPLPSYFRRQFVEGFRSMDLDRPRWIDKTAIELASYSIVWWAVFGLTRLIGMDEGVSRQTANFPYVMWITAFNTSFILAYVVLDMIFYPLPVPKPKITSPPSPASRYYSPTPTPPPSPIYTPPLLEAINKNSLLLFLLANVGTGLVNVSMQTMYAETATSMGVLTLYALAFCCVAWALRQTRVWRL